MPNLNAKVKHLEYKFHELNLFYNFPRNKELQFHANRLPSAIF